MTRRGTMRLHAVVDTNVVCSGALWPESVPGQIIDLAEEGGILLLAPISVAWELDRIVPEVSGMTAAEAERLLRNQPISWMYPEHYEHFMESALAAIRDRDDAPLVAAALALKTGVISGDKHFHPLREPVVPTWRPRDFRDIVVKRGVDAPRR